MEKVIVLSSPLLEQAYSVAQRKGVEIETLVTEWVRRGLSDEEQTTSKMLETRRKLQEFARRMRPSIDLDEEMRQIRKEVGDVIEANQEFVDLVTSGATDRKWEQTP